MNVKSEREVAQSCPTFSDPRDCSLPGSSVHGIFQARALEWGAICVKQIASGQLLDSTGSSAWCSVMTLRAGMGEGKGGSKRGRIYAHIYLIDIVHWKVT